MRPNRYVILVSLALGAVGIWFTVDALQQYFNVTRSFTSVHIEYVDETFVWDDAAYEHGTGAFRITNNAPNDVVIAHVTVNLFFDGQFAGGRYQPWERIAISSGESADIEMPFFISIAPQRERAENADLSVSGQMRLEFDGIEQGMTVRFNEQLGEARGDRTGQR
jgi:hypothetical protein